MAGTTETRGKEAYRLVSELMLFPMVVLAMLFFYVSGSYLFGPDWSGSGTELYIIMVLVAMSMAWFAVEPLSREERRERIAQLLPFGSVVRGAFLWFTGFLVTWLAVLVLFEQGMGYEWPTLTRSSALASFYLTIFLVTPGEEILFRGVLPNLSDERYLVGFVPVILVGSQATFAVFHLAAYGGFGMPMLTVFILGVVWVLAARRWGLWLTMGSHAAYNLSILGILTGGVT